LTYLRPVLLREERFQCCCVSAPRADYLRSPAKQPATGPSWLHEIKHDGLHHAELAVFELIRSWLHEHVAVFCAFDVMGRLMMVENVTPSAADILKRMLDVQLSIGEEKPVGYLPIKTVERHIGISIPAYKSMIESRGNSCSVFPPEESCINSGAIYAYNKLYLDKILKDNLDILSKNGWPVAAEDFIRKIASGWLDDASPIMPIIKKAFGDPT
jgi:hypothetical protein